MALRLLLASSCLCLVLQLALADEKSVLLEWKAKVDPDNKAYWDPKNDVCSYSGVTCTGGKVSAM
jgi:hypothetical protein